MTAVNSFEESIMPSQNYRARVGNGCTLGNT